MIKFQTQHITARVSRHHGWLRTAIAMPLLTVVVGLALTGWISIDKHRSNELIQTQLHLDLARRVSDEIERLFGIYAYGLKGARGVVLAVETKQSLRNTFQEYSRTRDIRREFPGSLGFGRIDLVQANAVTAYVEMQKASGAADFAIRELSPNPGTRFVITQIEPTEPNRQARGLDIASEPHRRQAAIDAARSGDATITAPITLVQATGERERGFLVMLPVYDRTLPQATPDERWAATLGWTYSPVIIDRVLQSLAFNPNDYWLRLTDVTNSEQPTVFFQNGDLSRSTLPIVELPRQTLGRVWKIELAATQHFYDQLNLAPVTLIAAAGTGITLMLALVQLLLLRGREQERDNLLQRERLAVIVSTANDAIIALDNDGNIGSWNASAEQLLGHTAGEAIGKHFESLLHIQPSVEQPKHSPEQPTADELTVRRQDGTTLSVSVRRSAINDATGTRMGTSLILRDESARKAYEKALLRSKNELEEAVGERTRALIQAERDLRAVLDAVPSMIGYWDSRGMNRFANRAYRNWFRVQHDDLSGKHISDLIGPELYAQNLPYIEGALAGKPQVFARDIPRPDGQGVRHALANYLPDIIDGAVRGFYVVVHDVTELQKSRDDLATALGSLREERQRLETILNSTGVGTWIWDVDSGHVTFDERWAALLGYRSDELAPNISTRIGLAHPDDLARSRNVLRAHLKGETPLYDFEGRLRHRDGHWVWILDRGQVAERDTNGRALRVMGTLLDISVLKAAQTRAMESEAFLEQVAKVAGMGGWEYAVKDGAMTWSAQARATLGLSAEQKLDWIGFTALTAAEGRKQLQLAIEQAVHRGKPFELELQVQVPGGRAVWVRVVGQPQSSTDAGMTDGPVRVIGALQDITEQRQTNLRFQALLESAPDAMVIVSGAGAITLVNTQTEKLFGMRREDMIGQQIERLLPARFHKAHQQHRSHFVRDMGSGMKLYAQHADGHEFPVEVNLSPIQTAEGLFVVSSVRDITQRLEIEKTLQDAKRTAEQANAAKSAFLANMSHEIRTPLNAIIGINHLLGETPLDANQLQLLQNADLAGRTLLGIVNDVLDISKIEAGEIELEHGSFNVHELLADLQAIYLPQASVKRIAYEVTCADDVPSTLVGDRPRVLQVVANLIANALKFTPSGKVKVHAQATSLDDGKCKLSILVTDTGIGIPADVQERIFQPFVQADVSTTRKFGGTGLGLAIVRELVQRMSGSVSVQSQVGQGSEFKVELVLDQSPEATEATHNVRPVVWLLISTKK